MKKRKVLSLLLSGCLLLGLVGCGMPENGSVMFEGSGVVVRQVAFDASLVSGAQAEACPKLYGFGAPSVLRDLTAPESTAEKTEADTTVQYDGVDVTKAGTTGKDDDVDVKEVKKKDHTEYKLVKNGRTIKNLRDTYDTVGYFGEGLARVGKDGKFGYINTKGKLIIPLQYEEAETFWSGAARVRKGGKYGYIDQSGGIVYPLELDAVGAEHEGLRCVRKDDKIGFINSRGKLVIPLEYDTDYFVDYQYATNDFGRFFENGLAVLKKDGKYGCVNTKNEVVLPFTLAYEYMSNFDQGYAKVQEQSTQLAGVIDSRGQLVIPCLFNRIGDFDLAQDYAIVQGFSTGGASNYNGHWGRARCNGDVVVPLQYDEIYVCGDYTLAIRNGSEYEYGYPKSSYLYRGAEEIHRFEPVYYGSQQTYYWIQQVSDSLLFCNGALFRLADGQLAAEGIKGRPERTTQFENGFLQMYVKHYSGDSSHNVWESGYSYTWIDEAGTVFMETRDGNLKPLVGDGLVGFLGTDRWGYEDMDGNLVIPCEYSEAAAFENGYARVEKDGKWGVIDKTGKVVVPLDYDEVGDFSGGLAAVERESLWYLTDGAGNLSAYLPYDYVGSLENGVAIVAKGNKLALLKIEKTEKPEPTETAWAAGNTKESEATL
ncbi:MAG: WG repeat-containing protein [Oscillospiraceae bacterium]|jgi:hypothetical protein|nr:WG repeat-containing protein [Oscillospiraceae bacterium]